MFWPSPSPPLDTADMTQVPPTAPPFAIPSSRRTFLAWLAAMLPATTGFRLPFASRIAALEKLNPVLLRALANAVLPSEIGAGGARSAAAGFEKWVTGYRPGAELNHGYGTDRIRTTGADPSTRWALQLRTLDLDARRAHRAGFASITAEQRRVLVRAQLAEERATTLPGDIASAGHVALALLASFYASPAATDLCYEATISRNACRPLAAVTSPPIPLRRRGEQP